MAKRMYKRKANRQSNFKKYAGTAFSIASKALTTAIAVKKLLNVEHKIFNITGSGSVTTAGTVTQLSGVNQGEYYDNRIGNSIKAVSLLFRGSVSINSGATASVWRCMIFRDKNSSPSAIPTVTTVLESASPFSPINHTEGDRFEVLYDAIHPLSINGTRISVINRYLKMNNHIKFSDDLGTDLDYGQIYVLFVSNDATSPSTNWNSKLVYIDN